MITSTRLREMLKRNNLPSTRPTFKKLEELGIILKPANPQVYKGRTDRLYTDDEAKININRVRDHYAKKSL